MKDIGASIRTMYGTLLGSITYNGASVPFYDEEPFVTVPDYHIVLTSIDQSDISTDQRWSHEVTVTLDIVTKQNMRNDRTAVDAITNSVLAALLPDTFQYRTDTDFEIFIINASSPGYIHEQDGKIHVNRKILRVLNRLTQK